MIDRVDGGNGWVRRALSKTRKAIEGPPPELPSWDPDYKAPGPEPWTRGWVAPLSEGWRLDIEPGTPPIRVIRHLNVPEDAQDYYCRLSYEIKVTPEGERLGIADIRTESCGSKVGHTTGHARALLREMHRLESGHAEWSFTTGLSHEGRGFFCHVAPWIESEFGVTLRYPPPLL